MTNCTFNGNSAETGGGMANNTDSSPTVTNCTFSGNLADFGGGMAMRNNNPVVTNCTFSGNTAAESGGGMHNSNSNPTVTNCVLWANSPNELNDSGTPTITYTDVQGGWRGTGNIDADPQFSVPPSGDLRLSPGSPCIDAANSNAVPAGIVIDLDGNARFVDDPNMTNTGFGSCPVDMGAYEFQQGLPCTPCPWDCGDGDGTAGIVDFLALLAQWGGPGSCDFDGGGVGIVDFLELLANWGPCP